jgi:hypothetical protein
MIRIVVATSFSVLLTSACLSQQGGRRPQGLTCPEQLARLSAQYATECSGRFGRPPACDRCPKDSASCATKCDECKIIDQQLKKKEDECGR